MTLLACRAWLWLQKFIPSAGCVTERSRQGLGGRCVLRPQHLAYLTLNRRAGPASCRGRNYFAVVAAKALNIAACMPRAL